MEDVQIKKVFAKRDFLGFSQLDGGKIIELFDYSLFMKKEDGKLCCIRFSSAAR